MEPTAVFSPAHRLPHHRHLHRRQRHHRHLRLRQCHRHHQLVLWAKACSCLQTTWRVHSHLCVLARMHGLDPTATPHKRQVPIWRCYRLLIRALRRRLLLAILAVVTVKTSHTTSQQLSSSYAVASGYMCGNTVMVGSSSPDVCYINGRRSLLHTVRAIAARSLLCYRTVGDRRAARPAHDSTRAALMRDASLRPWRDGAHVEAVARGLLSQRQVGAVLRTAWCFAPFRQPPAAARRRRAAFSGVRSTLMAVCTAGHIASDAPPSDDGARARSANRVGVPESARGARRSCLLEARSGERVGRMRQRTPRLGCVQRR